MVLYKNKSFSSISSAPNSNYTGDADYVIPDGSELAKKVISYYPYFNIIIDKAGNLVDIEPTERPPKEYVPTQEDMNVDFDYRISCIELGL